MSNGKLYTFMLCLSVLVTFAEMMVDAYVSGRKLIKTTKKIRKRLK